MNNIRWFELVFQQLRPIHIGKLNYGVLSETEIFIPGQTMWGALTKNYNLANKINLNENQNLFSSITCFFPSLDGKNVLAPCYKDGVFCLNEGLSEDDFRFAFVDTFVSTAVNPLSREAADESLHEMDFVLPGPKNVLPQKGINKETRLKWIGLVGLEEYNSSVYDFLQEDKLIITIGGEIKYGFGVLELISVKEINEEFLEKWNLTENGNLFIKNKDYTEETQIGLRNFVEINSRTCEKMKFEGNVIPIAEFDFTNNMPKIKEASLYINVGSKIYTLEKQNKSVLDEYKLSKGKFKAMSIFL